MNRRIAVILVGIVAFIGLAIWGAINLGKHFTPPSSGSAVVADIKELTPPVGICDKNEPVCFVPVPVAGEARDHPAESFDAVEDFKRRNPGLGVDWPWVFASQGVYVHWICECTDGHRPPKK